MHKSEMGRGKGDLDFARLWKEKIPAMAEIQEDIQEKDPEDILIRRLLIGGAVGAVLFFLLTVLVITVLISMNFNVLEWME